VLLPVSAPFHCSLMAPAAKAMEEALLDVHMHAPAVPLIANVLAAPITDPVEIRHRLVEQVTGMVRWRESMAWLGANGVDTLVEVGAGKVLSGLARRIVPGAATLNVGTPEEVDAVVAKFG
jgi:[acyl-carrier-protein] S-malonyltransferase